MSDDKLEHKIASALGKGYFRVVFAQEKSGASKEEMRAAWQEQKKDYIRMGRRIARQLERYGLRVVEDDK